MEAFGKFWDANAMLIGIGFALAALAVAILLRHGTLASVLGLISGMAFMWVGKSTRVAADGPDED